MSSQLSRLPTSRRYPRAVKRRFRLDPDVYRKLLTIRSSRSHPHTRSYSTILTDALLFWVHNHGKNPPRRMPLRVSLTPLLYATLQEAAARFRIPMTDLVNYAVREFDEKAFQQLLKAKKLERRVVPTDYQRRFW